MDVEIYGEFIESRTSGTDIEFYVNTGNDGIQSCDSFFDMINEMEEHKLDPKNKVTGSPFLMYSSPKLKIKPRVE